MSRSSRRQPQIQSAIRAALEGNETPLKAIPLDVLRYTVDYLDNKSILKLCETSQYFRNTVCRSEHWKQKLRQNLTSNPDRLRKIENAFKFYLMFREASPENRKSMAAEYGFDKYLLPMIAPVNQITEKTEYRRAVEEGIMPVLAKGGYLDMLEDLVAKGYRTHRCIPAAVESGDLQVAQFVYDHAGPDFEIGADAMFDAFRIAIENNDIPMIQFLLDHGGDLHEPSSDDEHLIIDALHSSNRETIQFLLDHDIILEDENISYVYINDDIDVYRYIFEELGYPIPSDLLTNIIRRDRSKEIVDYIMSFPEAFSNYDAVISWLSPQEIKFVIDHDPEPNFAEIFKSIAKSRLPYDNAKDLFDYVVLKGGDPTKVNFEGKSERGSQKFQELMGGYDEERFIDVTDIAPRKTGLERFNELMRFPTKPRIVKKSSDEK